MRPPTRRASGVRKATGGPARRRSARNRARPSGPCAPAGADASAARPGRERIVVRSPRASRPSAVDACGGVSAPASHTSARAAALASGTSVRHERGAEIAFLIVVLSCRVASLAVERRRSFAFAVRRVRTTSRRSALRARSALPPDRREKRLRMPSPAASSALQRAAHGAIELHALAARLACAKVLIDVQHARRLQRAVEERAEKHA